MQLTVLGAGTPLPAAERFGSSYIVTVGDDNIMFDCGPATTHKMVKAGFSPTDIDNLFFTHHHFDHDVDYPCFLLSRWNLCTGKENDLRVFGPNYTERLTHRLMDEHEGAFAQDWIARMNHPLSVDFYVQRGGTLPRKGPEVEAKDVGPGKIFSGKDWEVTAAPAEHVQPWLDSLAYRLDSDEGSIVITGDTGPCDTVLDLAKGADTMVCMCIYIQGDIEGGPEEKTVCGSTAAAQLAQDAGVEKLVLVHQAHWLDDQGQTERALGDITSVYDGEVVWGREIMKVAL
jgi:ribonuclease Z